MKAAILYSGHMRSFDLCLPNHAQYVHRHFPGADIYCATVRDEDSAKADLLPSGKIALVEKQPVFPLPPSCPAHFELNGRPYLHAGYPIITPPQGIIGQLWQLRNVWSLLPEGHDYDCFVRIRPDIYFHEYRHALPRFEIDALTPWWETWGGVNDRFAVLGRKAAEAYFTTFDRIGGLVAAGCPLHPETILHRSLETSGCAVHDNLMAIFSKWGKNGAALRGPVISGIDIAHACLKAR